MDPRKANGGVFLGLNGIVIKSHGGTDAEGFAAAVDIGYDMVRYELLDKIGETLHRATRTRSAPRAGRRSRLVTVSRSVVLGCGSYLPARVLTNDDLAAIGRHLRRMDRAAHRHPRAPHRGRRRTHLRPRRCMPRARRSPMPQVDAQSIDLIVLATSTPDNTFPATAVSVQAGLGITHGAAFDLQAVCSGFVYALATADGLLRTGAFKRALVIGAETFSRILDWTDRTTCVLFGDGAGAVVLEAQEQPGTREDRGVLTAHLRSDGRHKTKLYVDGGPSSTADRRPSAHGRQGGVQHAVGDDHRRDRGRVRGHRLHAPTTSTGSCRTRPTSASSTAPPTSSASRRRRWSSPSTATATRRRPRSRWRSAMRVADGRIKRGDLVLLEAMGGGFTWGAALLRW